jgi:hypothetical protein
VTDIVLVVVTVGVTLIVGVLDIVAVVLIDGVTVGVGGGTTFKFNATNAISSLAAVYPIVKLDVEEDVCLSTRTTSCPRSEL